MTSNERVCVWPDGEWCYESELEEMSHRSDDYTVIEIAEVEEVPLPVNPGFSCLMCGQGFDFGHCRCE